LEGEGDDEFEWSRVGSLCCSLLSGLKVKVGSFRVKFVNVCE